MFHRDQGAQFTSTEFTNRLEMAGIRISLDGRGRALDNVFVERRWRTVKYEEVYLKDYETPRQATRELGQYFAFYNEKRLHQALAYQTPAVVYFESSVSQAILIYASNCLDDGVHLSTSHGCIGAGYRGRNGTAGGRGEAVGPAGRGS